MKRVELVELNITCALCVMCNSLRYTVDSFGPALPRELDLEDLMASLQTVTEKMQQYIDDNRKKFTNEDAKEANHETQKSTARLLV